MKNHWLFKLCGLFFVFAVSCNPEKRTGMEPIEYKFEDDTYFAVLLPQEEIRQMRLVKRKDETEVIYADFRNLSDKRIQKLESGDYFITVNGVEFDIDELKSIQQDIIIRLTAKGPRNNWVKVEPVLPSPVVFRRNGEADRLKSIPEMQRYYIAVRDLDKSIIPEKLKARLSGKDILGNTVDDEFDFNTRTGDRIRSSRMIPGYIIGDFVLTVTIDGSSNSDYPPLSFSVIDNDTAGPRIVNKDNKFYFNRDKETRVRLQFVDPSGIDEENTRIKYNGIEYRPTRFRYTTARTHGFAEFTLGADVLEDVQKGQIAKIDYHFPDADKHHPGDQEVSSGTISMEEGGIEQEYLLSRGDGHPLPGVQVTVFRSEGGLSKQTMGPAAYRDYYNSGERIAGDIRDSVYTDKYGIVTIENIPPDTDLVFAVGSEETNHYLREVPGIGGPRGTISISFGEIPAKGSLVISATIAPGALDDWLSVYETDNSRTPYLYYESDKEAGPRREDFLNGNPQRIEGHFRKISDDNYEFEFDFGETIISEIENVNYLLVVHFDSMGDFSMANARSMGYRQEAELSTQLSRF
ncbi:MAG: hypothetical protein LBE10_11490 [Treponema sp.]|jgi:hypothetical protein|nr:hypothetical protein [Treponema sp.]